MKEAKSSPASLLRIDIRGVVQGVGFRPFIYRLAHRFGLAGWVRNTSKNVEIEVEGPREKLFAFLKAVEEEAPPMSKIKEIRWEEKAPKGYTSFEIRKSLREEGEYQLVSPDIATCGECLREIFDPKDRRYRYPFTNCTNCGPRFTIIIDIPYDRPNTTMRKFTMCPDCRREYEDPLDRRFHAQPNACPACGPKLFLTDDKGRKIEVEDEIKAAADLLRRGKIVAIKGLGGFHLACDATNTQAVETLKARKRRPSKPLAVMIRDLEEVRRHCLLSPEEEKLLASSQSPIVLLRWRKGDSEVSESVAPKLKYLGVMLPYTPLHHLLLHEIGRPLVMTSGNLTEEPIAKDNEEALRRLSGIADYFLLHDRDIYSRYDDSVAMVEDGRPRLIRRARGYAPFPITLPFISSAEILACGAELKNTFCLVRDKYAFVSQHIGDMENEETLEHFCSTVKLYERLFRINPKLLVCDMHPDYLATRYAHERAEEEGLELLEVQHHHAHIASCLAENGRNERVIGVAFDGTGFGADGTIWGGEFLIADLEGFERAGHLEYSPLPGGEAGIRKPYRIALGYVLHFLGEEGLERARRFFPEIGEQELEILRFQIQRKINSPPTSSCGRLFDAVSALIGVRRVIDYEGQAAAELEMAAYDDETRDSYPFEIEEESGRKVVLIRGIVREVLLDLEERRSQAYIAAKFHNTVARIIACMCEILSRESGIKTVALSGGVFQNRLLLRRALKLLRDLGFEVLLHSEVPPNDGGISLGQAAVAAFTRGR